MWLLYSCHCNCGFLSYWSIIYHVLVFIGISFHIRQNIVGVTELKLIIPCSKMAFNDILDTSFDLGIGNCVRTSCISISIVKKMLLMTYTQENHTFPPNLQDVPLMT